MLPPPLTALMALLLLTATAGAQDRVTLVHYRADTAKQKALLYTHTSNGPASPFVGAAIASAMKLPKVAGKKPLRQALPADWDGDGTSELVLVREFTNSSDQRMDLRIYRMPDSLFDRLGGKLASSEKRDLGYAAGDGRIVVLGSGNIFYGGPDELLLIRESLSGEQSLEVRNLPPGRKRAMGPPLLSDTSFGNTTDGRVISLFGHDLDGDGRDEIVTLLRNAQGTDRVELVQAPLTTDGETGAAVASYLDVTPSDDFQNIAITGIDLDGDGRNELMLQQRNDAGAERLVVHALPTSPGQALETPLSLEENPGIAGASYPLLAAFGWGPRPPNIRFLAGEWSLWIETLAPAPNPGPSVLHGPYTSQATISENSLVLTASPLPLSMHGPVSLTGDPIGTVDFVNSSFSLPLPDASHTMIITFGQGVLYDLSGVLTMDFHNHSGRVIHNASGNITADVISLYFSKTP